MGFLSKVARKVSAQGNEGADSGGGNQKKGALRGFHRGDQWSRFRAKKSFLGSIRGTATEGQVAGGANDSQTSDSNDPAMGGYAALRGGFGFIGRKLKRK